MAYSIEERVIDGRVMLYRESDGTKVLSREDQSAGEPFEYHHECPSCWLGHPHSRLYHLQSLLLYYTGLQTKAQGVNPGQEE